MKKFTLIVLFIASVAIPAYSRAFVAASDTTPDSKNFVDPSGKRQGWWVITGKMRPDLKGYGPDAKVEEGNYKDSQKTGVWTEYYANGNKKSELTYVNNRPNGHAVMYNDNGKKSEEGTWVGTRWTGPYTLYYDDGTPRQSFNYNQLGRRDGTQTYYHPNGKVAITVDMKDGKETGWKKEYDENGNLIRETYFNDGVIDASKTKTYNVPPAPVSKAPEEDKMKKTPPPPPDPNFKPNKGVFNGEGDWILYKNGQITMKGTFHKNRLVDGEERIYDGNGMLVRIKLYKNGQYVGDGPLPTDANK
ncbi:MAG TPA: hypothetical protein VFU15_01475 [Bacteroidia bacterium]|nr:hypothetical protein [Bacteroidia bacterium]